MNPGWKTIMSHRRINPRAVCRQLLTHLDEHKPLTAREEGRILRALETSGVENATTRMLAGLTRQTLKALMAEV